MQQHPTRRTVLASGALGLVGLVAGVGGLSSANAAVVTPSGALSWDDPKAWDSGKVPGPSEIAVVRRPVLLSGKRSVGGVLVESSGELVFDPSTSTTLLSSGSVIVRGGRLVLRPSSRLVQHRLTFVGVDEASFVGGGHEVLPADVGLWVSGLGVLDAVGAPTASWNRTGNDPTWSSTDEVYAAPTAVGDYTTFARHLPGSSTQRTLAPSGLKVSTEAFNVSRNVIIGGTAAGRAHVAFMHSQRPQTIRFVRFEHVGPRRLVPGRTDGVTELVTGRYGMHFHHCADATRGSLIEGVVVAHCGTRAFVPHASHGITFRDCLAYDIAGEAYWWDAQPTPSDTVNNSHGIRYEHCAAFKIGAQPKVLRDNTLSAFSLGAGRDNACIDSVAAGMSDTGVQSSAFEWPENDFEGGWEFTGCTAHNNRSLGIFFWQNDPHYRLKHLLEDFTLYGNGVAAIVQGAYLNNVTYRGGRVFANGSRTQRGQWLSQIGWNNTIEGVSMDAGAVTDYALVLGEHRTSKDPATLVKDVDLRGARVAAIGVDERLVPGLYDFVGVTVNGVRDLEPSDFKILRVASGSRFRVQRSNGTAFVIDGTGSSRVIPAFA